MSNVPPASPASPSPINPYPTGSSRSSGGSFKAKQYVAPGTRFHTVIAYLVGLLGLIFLAAVTFGFGLLLRRYARVMGINMKV